MPASARAQLLCGIAPLTCPAQKFSLRCSLYRCVKISPGFPCIYAHPSIYNTQPGHQRYQHLLEGAALLDRHCSDKAGTQIVLFPRVLPAACPTGLVLCTQRIPTSCPTAHQGPSSCSSSRGAEQGRGWLLQQGLTASTETSSNTSGFPLVTCSRPKPIEYLFAPN